MFTPTYQGNLSIFSDVLEELSKFIQCVGGTQSVSLIGLIGEKKRAFSNHRFDVTHINLPTLLEETYEFSPMQSKVVENLIISSQLRVSHKNDQRRLVNFPQSANLENF